MSCGWLETGFALPSRVIFVRGAEPIEHGLGLSLKGKERAEAFVPFFLGREFLQDFGPPATIIAHRPSQKEPSRSYIDAVTPLANALGIKVDTQFGHTEYEAMVNYVRDFEDFDGKTILISWDNDDLALMVALFGVKPKPLPWPEQAYDRLWIIDFQQQGKARFKNLPQRLLYGDSFM